MRKILSFTLTIFIIMTSVCCFAQDSDFQTMQARALYSLTQDGNTITIADNGVSVSDRNITVSFSSDNLVANSSEVVVIAYLQEQNYTLPNKENIYYLNQLVYKNSSVTFAFPEHAPSGIYTLLIGAEGFDTAARAVFGYGFSGNLIIGDINNDNVVNTLDIIKLKYYLELEKNLPAGQDISDIMTVREKYVADFDQDGEVNSADVAAMKSAIANRDFSN